MKTFQNIHVAKVVCQMDFGLGAKGGNNSNRAVTVPMLIATEGITRRIDYSLIRNKYQRCKVLYEVEDIATYLVEYVKFCDDWEVDRYGNANLVTMEYLVNISKRRAFWSLNEDILKITILETNTPYPSRKIRPLFDKWNWRFLTKKRALWRNVIFCFHGDDGGFGSSSSLICSKGVWSDILKDYELAEDVVPELNSSLLVADAHALIRKP
ncbi:hypothetical protein Tco_1282895 [Tanacetum coccineum]